MMTPEREKDIRHWAYANGDLRQSIAIVRELLAELDRVREQDNIGNELIKVMQKERDRLRANLETAVEALKRINHPSDWLDHGSNGIVIIAKEALAKIRGEK